MTAARGCQRCSCSNFAALQKTWFSAVNHALALVCDKAGAREIAVRGLLHMVARSIVLGAGSVAALCAPVAAQAADAVRFASDVFIERFVASPGGRTSRILERADQLRPGDRVIFVVNWTAQRRSEFTVTNPMPRTVAFQRSVDGAEEVSVDGGRNWGRMEDLIVKNPDGGFRSATPEDVTHLRWRVPGPLAQRGSGQLTYRGVVR